MDIILELWEVHHLSADEVEIIMRTKSRGFAACLLLVFTVENAVFLAVLRKEILG